ncbi:LysE family translocator [Shewanella pneumatophori]|uniref:LysE family translocator n=1 Tax=Shewanella pneumatophori TaxID=314092 RepID=A0A9X1ZD06_9GAMM|nr:LysE family translocator [Shewanella pneumatophori]
MEIFSLAILGVIIVISPGADFVLVLKNSINRSRKAGCYTAIGISLAISVHIGYSLLGIGYLVSHNQWLFNLIRYAGALYLIYLGITGLLAKPQNLSVQADTEIPENYSGYLLEGFLCNVLNPKTMLFFLSIFSQVMTLDSNNEVALLYGVYIMLLHLLWFLLVALLFTSKPLQSVLMKAQRRLNQLCGVALIGFGVALALHD